ncbi:adenylosuccinate lyase [Cellulophaga sp. HaHaR_3_176]|uniref:adenylosuccinate lyase n=1 Tax=Cellulophaga sp. HaHaR_3_176 TaxID=1942464 RepID=UPI001C1FCACB|nr:adenylosuccinate lyase [Cellulophaga sp. HaHaR_3_176]QWX82608.1 adenylosuccinate lyase [Cellulophaga sp. HaHaR_3_176]
METIELKNSLNYVNHSREKRAEMSLLVLENPNLIEPLLKIAFTVKDPISSKACWVLEFTAKEKLSFIFPYLNEFTSKMGTVYLHPSVRPMAKICEYLITSYFSKSPNNVKEFLNNVHLERITTACFDWLIGEHKVAAQAYSMTCLLLLGKKFDWILPELKIILEKNYAQGSSAYKARARMTLAKIK